METPVTSALVDRYLEAERSSAEMSAARDKALASMEAGLARLLSARAVHAELKAAFDRDPSGENLHQVEEARDTYVLAAKRAEKAADAWDMANAAAKVTLEELEVALGAWIFDLVARAER